MNDAALCSYPEPHWLLFSENVPALVHFSHLPIVIFAVLLGAFVLSNGRKVLANQILFTMLTVFSLWVLLDSVFWAANRSDIVMYVWSLQVLIEPLIHIGALYLIVVLVRKADVSFWAKLAFALLYLPVIVLTPTSLFLPGFDLSTCLAVESKLSYYTYALEALATLFIIAFAAKSFVKESSWQRRKEVALLSIGTILFLLSFSWGAITGSFTEDWGLAQYGLFGMPVFMAFLAYSIVRFRTFNIKLIGAQALVAALAALSGAQFFFIQSRTNFILNSLSFVLVLVFGFFLVRSVKREIAAREGLQAANDRLRELDRQKTEFVSFATHQLRSPLTSMRGNVSLILEGDYGPIGQGMREVMTVIATSVRTMVNVVEDYLNVSRIELGTMKYNFQPQDVLEQVNNVIAEQKVSFDAKGIKVSVTSDGAASYPVSVDPDKFKQVIMNLVDNSIKYTPRGSVDISVAKVPERGVIRMLVSDTGVGIHADVIPKLFQKFSRAPKASEANIHGTGLGLFIAREIMSAHGGRIWAESAGEGKGSQFYIEIPEAK